MRVLLTGGGGAGNEACGVCWGAGTNYTLLTRMPRPLTPPLPEIAVT